MIWYDVMWYDIGENWERENMTGQEKRSSVRSKMKRNPKKSQHILMYTRIAKWYSIVIIVAMKIGMHEVQSYNNK